MPGCCRRAVTRASRSNRAASWLERPSNSFTATGRPDAHVARREDPAHAAARDLGAEHVPRRVHAGQRDEVAVRIARRWERRGDGAAVHARGEVPGEELATGVVQLEVGARGQQDLEALAGLVRQELERELASRADLDVRVEIGR